MHALGCVLGRVARVLERGYKAAPESEDLRARLESWYRQREDWASLATLLWLGTMAIGLSVLLWFTCARLLGLTVAAIHTNLAPFYVMLMALAVGGTVSGRQLAGALLVAGGALLAQLSRPHPAAA